MAGLVGRYCPCSFCISRLARVMLSAGRRVCTLLSVMRSAGLCVLHARYMSLLSLFLHSVSVLSRCVTIWCAF